VKRVNVVGYYGWENFGDELFRAAIHINRELIWGPGVQLRSFVTPIRMLHQNTGPLGSITRLCETVIGGLWGDTIALCGGSVLEDVRGTQRLRSAVIQRNRRTEAIGVSLGPWRSATAKARVREYISQMDRVVVRDTASRTRVGLNISVGGDLAALYPMPIYELSERKYLTICPSVDSGASVDDVVAILDELLTHVDLPVRMLALNVRRRHGDVEFSHQIRERLARLGHDIEFERFDSLDQTIEIIAKSRAVWSQRLHGVIVSYLCDVPVLALSHHQKITDFASDIGLPPRFAPETLSPSGSTIRAAAETLRGRPSWQIKSEHYRQMTRNAFTLTDSK